MKKISFAAKPGGGGHIPSVDQWIAGEARAEPTKRLTIDVPLSLHRRVKTRCAIDDLVIADVVRELLARRFPEDTQRQGGPAEQAEPAEI